MRKPRALDVSPREVSAECIIDSRMENRSDADRIAIETKRPLFRKHPLRVERSSRVLGILSDELGILKAPIQAHATDCVASTRMFLHMKDFAKITRCVSNRNLGLMYTRKPQHGCHQSSDRYFNESRISRRRHRMIGN